MTPADFLDALRASGFSVRADGDRLLVAPSSRLTPKLCEALRAHKAALLDCLAERSRVFNFEPGFAPDQAVQLAEIATLTWPDGTTASLSAEALLWWQAHNQAARERQFKKLHLSLKKAMASGRLSRPAKE